jgi:hypothetical protein
MSKPVVLTVSKAIAAYNAGTLPARIQIQDSTFHVAAALDTIEQIALGKYLAGITLTNSAANLIITVAQLVNDSLALSKIATGYHLEVKDSAANVAGAFDALEHAARAGTLQEIAFTDAHTPKIALEAKDVSSYAEAIDKIASARCISVSGAAASIVKYLASLEQVANAGKIASIHITGTNRHLALTATQLSADSTALGKIAGTYLINVTDTAASVSAHLGALEAAAKAGTLASIALSDPGRPVLSINYAQYKTDGDALAKITSHYDLAVTGVTAAGAAGVAAHANVTSITVADTAAHVQAQLAHLESLAISAASNTAPQGAAPDSVNNHGELQGITLTDTGAAQFTLTTGQLTQDGAAISLISSPFQLNVTDVLAADAQGLASNPLIASLAVEDTGAHVSAALSSLESATGAGKLASITISDGIFTTRDESSDAIGVYEKLGGGSSLVLDLRTASAGGTLQPGVSIFSDALSDVLENGGFNVPASIVLPEFASQVYGGFNFSDIFLLQTALDNGTIASIQYPYNTQVGSAFTHNPHFGAVGFFDTTDLLKITNTTIINGFFATPPVSGQEFTGFFYEYTKLPITADQAVGYYGSYLSHAIAADAPGILYTTGDAVDPTDETALIENITDTAAAVSADLDALSAALAGRALPLPIILTDDVPASIAVSATQANADVTVLNAITTTYLLSIGNAGQLSTLDLSALTTEKIELTFTSLAHNVTIHSANVYDLNLADLAAGTVTVKAVSSGGHNGTEVDYGGHSITIDSTVPGSLTVYTPVDSASSLGAHGTQVTGGVSVATALTSSGSVAITDTAAHVSASLDALEAIHGQITGIGFSDSGTAMFTIDEPQLTADADVLAHLSGAYTLDVTDVAADDALAIAMMHDVSRIEVSDSAVNILADLDALEHIAKSGKLAAITITSGEVSFIDAPHLFADADVFRLLANNPDNIFM